MSVNMIVNMEGVLGRMTSRKIAIKKIIARFSLFFTVTILNATTFLSTFLFFSYFNTCDTVWDIFIRWEQRKREDGSLFKS